jgi:hypothetical protein
LDGNLKIKDSFDAILLPYQLSPANPEDQKFLSGTSTTMQTHITFVLAATGGVTPAWKLVPVSFNVNSSPFLQAGRTATDDVIITIGKKKDKVDTAHDITKIGTQNIFFLGGP